MSSDSLATDPTVSIIDLRCQVPPDVLAIGDEVPRLTWRVESQGAGARQLAYRIEAAGSADFADVVADSERVASADQVGIPAPGGALPSRATRFYRVRIETGAGWTDWSPVLRVEAGLLDPGDWTATAITLPDDPGSDRQAPLPLLRRGFTIEGTVAQARLYVTSLGVHRLTLNGSSVTDDLLAPGWTPYGKRLLSETYDVTGLLRAGKNVVAATIGDGWYRGRLGWGRHDRCRYGRTLALLAQLEVELADGSTVHVGTDADWRTSTGEVRSADLYDGSVIDLRAFQPGWDSPGFDDREWLPAEVVPVDTTIIEPRMAPPVRIIATEAVEPKLGSDGVVHLDGRQNIAGWVRLRVKGQRGDQVTIRHAEVREPDGSLHTRSLRSAKATDMYVLADDKEVWLEPQFTFHGFRHADVQADAQVIATEFVAISSATPARAHFDCSHAGLVRLHQNVAWSQRDNFVSVPTDCPQRDERLGWTGDAQAFAATASTLFDSQAFWASWLRDLALEQDDELGVPSVVPDVVVTGEARYGRAGWADAATIVPWAVYESYGDAEVLRDQFDSMRRSVDSLIGRRGPDGLLPESFQFGDWLDPDAPSDRPWETKADSGFLANAFFAHGARLAGEAAEVLGDDKVAAELGALADDMARLAWARWSDHARTNQTGCAVALGLHIASPGDRAAVAAELARMVREADGRVDTGFLGTPLILPVLTEMGHIDEAYLMLLRTEVRSWLYQVEQGATTVWERWDAIRPDGSIHPGDMDIPPGVEDDGSGGGGNMLSFNHYAYGAVIDWVYRNVAGISPSLESPGYRHTIIAPRPAAAIRWSDAGLESAYGPLRVAWRLDDDGTLRMDVELPFGTFGTLEAPITEASVIRIDGNEADQHARLDHGRHSIEVTAPHVVGEVRGG